MRTELAGKTAIVTGASEGYGVGIAEALIEEGAKVWITARREGLLTEVAERIGATPVPADVCSSEDWDRVFATVLGAAGVCRVRRSQGRDVDAEPVVVRGATSTWCPCNVCDPLVGRDRFPRRRGVAGTRRGVDGQMHAAQ